MFPPSTIKLVKLMNRIGSVCLYYPFSLVVEHEALACIQLKTNWELKFSRGFLYMGAADMAFLILLLMMPVGLNKLSLPERLFAVVIATLLLLFASLFWFVARNTIEEIHFAESMRKLEQDYDFQWKRIGIPSIEDPIIARIIQIVTIAPFISWICSIPAVLIILFTPSPVQNLLKFHAELWVRPIVNHIFGMEEYFDQIWIGLMIFLGLNICFKEAALAAFYVPFFCQVAFIYLHSTKKRLQQYQHLLRENRVSRSYELLVARMYLEYQVLNVLINDIASRSTAHFFSVVVTLITGLFFLLLKFPLDIFMTVAFSCIQLCAVVTLFQVIKGAVDLKQESLSFRQYFTYKELKRNSWGHKYWRSRRDYSIWVGHLFALEEPDFLIKVFGDFIVGKLIDLLILF